METDLRPIARRYLGKKGGDEYVTSFEEGVKSVMADGAPDSLTKEMIYIAVSATNSCNYCTSSHTAGARAKGLTDEMFAELMAVVGMANQTNFLANGFQVEVDKKFLNGGRG